MTGGGPTGERVTADAVVVGGGLNGAATAFFLQAAGIGRVVIIDAGMPGEGASGAAVGLLRTHYDNRPETELAARSMPYFRDWKNFFGEECGWRQTGFFRFVEPHETAKMERNVAVQRDYGETVEILSPDAFRQIAPDYRSDDIGAVVYEPLSGVADNRQAAVTLLKRACIGGAELRPFVAARSILIEGGRVVGLSTTAGPISTPIVVMAAGTGSRDLAASCGVDLPVVAKTIRVAAIVPREGARFRECFMDPISDSWLAPQEQGRAIISAPHPRAGQVVDEATYDRDFDRAHAMAGIAPVAHRLPGIAGATLAAWWGRADCYAPDGKPIIGGTPVAGLFANTAGAGKGHKTAPAAGRALGELIVDGVARYADITPFSLDRFSKAPASWGENEYGKRVIG